MVGLSRAAVFALGTGTLALTPACSADDSGNEAANDAGKDANSSPSSDSSTTDSSPPMAADGGPVTGVGGPDAARDAANDAAAPIVDAASGGPPVFDAGEDADAGHLTIMPLYGAPALIDP